MPATIHGKNERLLFEYLPKEPKTRRGEHVGGHIAAEGNIPAVAISVPHKALQVLLVDEQLTLVLLHQRLEHKELLRGHRLKYLRMSYTPSLSRSVFNAIL